MKLKMLLIAVVTLCTVFSACSGNKKANGPVKVISAYSEKTDEAILPLQLDLNCENGNMEIYSWNKNEIKYEMTRHIKGSGAKEVLQKCLDNFSITIGKEDNKSCLTCKYNGKNSMPGEYELDLKIFIPKKTTFINCIQEKGSLKFIDDLNCNINIDARAVDVEINSLDGKLLYTAKSGNLRISEGRMLNGSNVNIVKGNIRVKADFEAAGSYTFKTGMGIIELCMPEGLKAVFETVGQIEKVMYNERDNPAHFILENAIGKINVIRYH